MARSTSVGVLPFLYRKYKAMQVTPFNFDQYQVRTLRHDDGEVWFVAPDVCDALDVGNVSMAVGRLDDDEKGISSIDTLGGPQEVTIISESGLYSLVLTSRKPEAKRFKKWVTSEVLPSIRKTGSYSMAQPKATADLPDLVSACNALVASVDAKVLPKKDGAELIRAITLASFHGASVLMAASKAKPAKALPAPTQATLTNGESVPYGFRAAGTKSATDLLRDHGVSAQAKALYDAMEKQNMVTTRYDLTIDQPGCRVLIGEGLQHGQNVMLFESVRSNPYFYPDRFGALLKRVGLLVDATPKPTASERALRDYKNIVKDAWNTYGCETSESANRDGINIQYLTRSAIIHYLTIDLGKSEKTAKNFVAPKSDAMRALFKDGFLSKHKNGWLIFDGDSI